MAIDGLRIGLDLDGVVLHYEDALRQYTAKKKGINPSAIKPANDYSFAKSGWFDTEEEFKATHAEAVEKGLYRTLKPFEGASEKLWKLSDAGAIITVITSRFVVNGQHAKVISQTAANLEKNKIPFRSIVFDSEKNHHMADIYIDDSPSNIKRLRAEGRHVLVFDALYNRSEKGPRAKNWDEVYPYIISSFATPEEKKRL